MGEDQSVAHKTTQFGPFGYAIGTLLAIIVWLQWAPVQFGGHLTYFIVQGTSMLPRFRTNDLVIVRTSPHYHIGQLAAYHNLQLHAILFHQIVGTIGQRYIFKGLNNPVADAYQPVASQIVGRLWWSVPQAGKWLAFFRQPWHAAMLVTGLALLLWGGTISHRRRVEGNQRTPGKALIHFHHTLATGRSLVTVGTTDPYPSKSPKRYHWTSTGAQILVAVFLVAAVWAWMSPIRRTITRTMAYHIHSQFLYQAHVPSGPVYPTGTVEPGSSVFLKLTHAVNIVYQGQWTSPWAHASTVRGQGELLATMTSNSGWSSSWILASPTSWTGTHFSLRGTLNTDALNARIAQVNHQTGLPYNTYTLTITPHVTLYGQIIGQPFQRALTPPLTFSYSPYVMQLTSPIPDTSVLLQLHSHSTGQVGDPVSIPNQLGIGSVTVPVIPLRWITSTGLGMAVLLTLLGWKMQRRWEKTHNEADHIAAQFGDLVIPVVDTNPPSLRGAIPVPTMESLVKLADQYDRPIFDYTTNNTHRYILKSGQDTYYYQVQVPLASPSEAAMKSVTEK